MKSNFTEIESLKYDSAYSNFRRRNYIGLDENGTLDYCESRVSDPWVFVFSACPYKSLHSKGLYSRQEYPYLLNKYGDTGLSVGYWK